MKKIVIVGAGFGGLKLAQNLKNEKIEVLLIDKNNHHTFQPLLYQVATGGLEADSIAYPIRRIFRKQKNLSFRMAEALKVIHEKNLIETSIGEIKYDYLIIAIGSTNNFYNFSDVKDDLLPLKSVNNALDMRSYILQNLENAHQVKEEKEVKKIMSIAIVGGGPTGIELAGALAEMKKYVIPKDFPDLDLSKMNIYLFEAAENLLSSMSSLASKAAEGYLEKLGVNIYKSSKVKSYINDQLELEDGTTFLTSTVIWTAGVKGNMLDGLPSESMQGNRILVNEYNLVKGLQNVFAIGDIASHKDKENQNGLPMLAPVANQHGEHLAKNLIRIENGLKPKPFKYNDKGSMATIGRKKAVVDFPNKSIKGSIAWFIWLSVHIASLVGFRNKFVTFLDWFINYINYDRPLGLIIRKYKRK